VLNNVLRQLIEHYMGFGQGKGRFKPVPLVVPDVRFYFFKKIIIIIIIPEMQKKNWKNK